MRMRLRQINKIKKIIYNRTNLAYDYAIYFMIATVATLMMVVMTDCEG